MSPLTVTVIVIAVLVVIAAAILYTRKERTRRLRSQFGPEYDRVVKTQGNPRRAEDELLGREKRQQPPGARVATSPATRTRSAQWQGAAFQHFVSPL